MTNQGFHKFILPLKDDLFTPLSKSIDFEPVTNGRTGNHLVKVSQKGVPIVRTTTKYNQPAHDFSPIHSRIADNIKELSTNSDNDLQYPISFNNALIEIYDSSYYKMKYHSDQCLDLAKESYIALFSCYEYPNDLSENLVRKLKIKNKTTGEEFEFLLENKSVILFSTTSNSLFSHKIVLDSVSNHKSSEIDNRWLGITFRSSKTFIHFKNNQAFFSNGELLKLADEEEKIKFYKLRGQENRSTNFIYPEINYTLSLADTLAPIIE